MNEVVAQNNQIEQIDYKAKAIEWLQNMGTQLPQAQATQFLELCQAYKLNPFKREIYAVGYGNKFSIITGYEVYLKRAERTGKLNGWQCVTNDDNTKARVKIYRKDWQYPFEHEVLMQEVRQNSPIWQKMPIFMMKKVCIEQGFRLCFPDEMGGMPYGEEEVPYDRIIQSEEEIKPTEEVEVVKDVEEDNLVKLGRIVRQYQKELSETDQKPTPYELCKKAIESNNKEMISEMLSRCVVYLGHKGFKVA